MRRWFSTEARVVLARQLVIPIAVVCNRLAPRSA
jgi:hypothetical protein